MTKYFQKLIRLTAVFFALLGPIVSLKADELLEGTGGCLVIYDLPLAALEKRIMGSIDKLRDIYAAESGQAFTDMPQPYFRYSDLRDSAIKLQIREVRLHWKPSRDLLALALGIKSKEQEARPSDIVIIIGCIKGDEKRSFMELTRWWTMIGPSHIPYTKIRLWKSMYTAQQLLKSDLEYAYSRGEGTQYHRVLNVNIPTRDLVTELSQAGMQSGR